MADERERVFKPFEKKRGIPYQEFEEIVRIITTDHFGPVKTENSLKSALAKLDRLDPGRADLKADNFHELMRVHEAMNIQQVAKITATAALARKETRFPPYHYRADFTETDDENYCGLIVVKKDQEGRITTRFEPLFYES
jgi:succinate dehydrogenase/fumarate reductase flavoprotein subunit